MENTFQHQLTTEPIGRRIVMGILYVVMGIGIYVLFLRPVAPGLSTGFELNPGGSAQILPTLTFSTTGLLIFFILASVAFGGIQLVFSVPRIRLTLGKWFTRWSNFALAFVVAFFLMAFLTWAAAGKSLNMAGLFVTTLGKSVPITLGALSGMLCERAGVWNIAIEGMMLTGAFVGTLVGSVTHSLWFAMFAAILSGVLIGAIHAVLSIKYKVNQIISGTVINILATGLTSYLSEKFLQVYQNLNNPGVFSTIRVPILADIPFFGPILFNNNIYVYAMYFFIILLTIMFFSTRVGLRMRSVGEHPAAADTLGINVIKTRYLYVLLSGAMAAFAGSYFTLGSVGRFDQVMTGGRGFIGLAAMLFGNYMPLGGFSAGLLFGFADSLKDRLAILNVNIPSQFLLMAPYLATMIVLAGVVGRSRPPAAGGQPYEKE
jgi:ABC-type uncharacterized transport system permease subunit